MLNESERPSCGPNHYICEECFFKKVNRDDVAWIRVSSSYEGCPECGKTASVVENYGFYGADCRKKEKMNK